MCVCTRILATEPEIERSENKLGKDESLFKPNAHTHIDEQTIEEEEEATNRSHSLCLPGPFVFLP